MVCVVFWQVRYIENSQHQLQLGNLFKLHREIRFKCLPLVVTGQDSIDSKSDLSESAFLGQYRPLCLFSLIPSF